MSSAVKLFPRLKLLLVEVRAAFRLSRTALHLLWGVATVACVFPLLPRPARLALKRRWSRQLLDTLGVRLHTAGLAIDGGLFVANHISWLDIFAINATAPTAFVSKAEIRQWPVVGWLCARTETVFLERGSRAAAVRAKQHLVELLRLRHRVGFFPEGTTSEGLHVLPFHGALFQAAIDAGVRVAPVLVRYTDAGGAMSTAPAYVGDTSFWECLRTIVRADGVTAHTAFLPTLDAPTMDRRHLAHRAHTVVSQALTPSRWVPPDGHTASGTHADPRAARPSGHPPTGSQSPAPADSSPV